MIAHTTKGGLVGRSIRPAHIVRGSGAPHFPPWLLQARLADSPFDGRVTLDAACNERGEPSAYCGRTQARTVPMTEVVAWW